MKNNLLTFLFLVFSLACFSQGGDQRAVATKIADLLARFPAENKEQLDQNVKALESFDKAALSEMIAMFSAPGKGNNTALEYAVNAYAANASRAGKEKERAMLTGVLCTAISDKSLGSTRQFFITQLQLLGKDDAVTCLNTVLSDPQISIPAATAIAQINSEAAKKVLLGAMNSPNEKVKLSIIESVGYTRYRPAVPTLHKLAANGNEDTRKVVHYALARIADPSSAKLLQDAANNAKYRDENTGATAAYLLFLQNLAKSDKAQSARLTAQLMQNASANSELQTKIAALNLFARINGNQSLPVLYRGMQDKDPEYRGAILQIASGMRNSISNRQWLKTLNSVSTDAKVQILYFLSGSADKNLVPQLKELLKDPSKDVRIAAVGTLARSGGEAAVPSLLDFLQNADKEEIAAVKSALLQLPSTRFAEYFAPRINSLPPAAKVALIEVIGARSTTPMTDQVFGLIDNQDTSIHRAAVNALPSLVGKQDINRLFEKVSSANQKDIAAYQQAIIRASEYELDTMTRTSLITTQMQSADPGKKAVYLDILGSIGGKAAVKSIEDIYNSGDAELKQSSITALAKIPTEHASTLLLKIARENSSPASVNAFIDVIARASFEPAQKVLLLQEAMQLATADNQKRRIIREAGRNRTFPSLIFVGPYLDNAALQQDAASAVLNIVLANNDFSGSIVRNLVTKTIQVMKGQDSDYQKQALQKYLDDMKPTEGFVSLFNGKDLTGWKGLVENPIKRSRMDASALAKQQQKADSLMRAGWEAKDGNLIFKGHGDNLATVKKYGDFELFIDWKITKDGDAGIYLRGTPQVQIWDTARRSVGAEVGSGGLYNNQKNPARPLLVADNPVGEWNNFHIIMKGDRVTVYLNGKLVTDNVILENYWDKNQGIFPSEQIELQAHGTFVAYRNIYIRELNASSQYSLSEDEKKDGFQVLFDGKSLDHWQGNKESYIVESGDLVVKPGNGSGGNLYTKNQYSNFHLRFEFQLTPGANNGLGVRTPLTGDAAYEGMELQILDNEADIYKNLKPYQYHGSVYGIIPARRGFLKPLGEWNYQEVILDGTKVKVILNNEVILDGDLKTATKDGIPDGRKHPGLDRASGHVAFLGHGSVVRFKNIRIKELK